MPPHQARQAYSRLVRHRQAHHGRSDSVWIGDGVLATALERYCYVSRSARAQQAQRMASSVPGPMESRRRLGKRHMTELGIHQVHPTLPPWALPVSPDLTQ